MKIGVRLLAAVGIAFSVPAFADSVDDTLRALRAQLSASTPITQAAAQEDPTCGDFLRGEAEENYQSYERYAVKVFRFLDSKARGCDPVVGGGLYGNDHGSPMFDTLKRICLAKRPTTDLYDAATEAYGLLRNACR